MRFKDKVVIISGAGAGMGRAAALAFAREGANLVLNSTPEQHLNSLAGEIRAVGGTVTAIKGDITKDNLAKAIVEKALEQYGKVDVLFNYVGGSPDLSPFMLFHKQTEPSMDRTIELNLKSTLLFCQAVLGSMIKRKSGKIINLGSIAGRVGVDLQGVYSAAKGGVIAFTMALAKEVAPHNGIAVCVPIQIPVIGAL